MAFHYVDDNATGGRKGDGEIEEAQYNPLPERSPSKWSRKFLSDNLFIDLSIARAIFFHSDSIFLALVVRLVSELDFKGPRITKK